MSYPSQYTDREFNELIEFLIEVKADLLDVQEDLRYENQEELAREIIKNLIQKVTFKILDYK